MELNLHDARDLVEDAIDSGTPIMLWGDTGIGKSSIIKQIARSRECGLVDFRASTRDAVDIMGVPRTSDGLTHWCPPAELPRVDKHGEKGILFIDEITNARMDVQHALYGLVLDGYVGEYTLPEGWVIVAAGNRVTDRSGAGKMSMALANRMAHVTVVPDLDTTTKHFASIGINPVMNAVLRYRPDLLHICLDPNANKNRDAIGPAFPTPRSLEEAAKFLNRPEGRRLRALTMCVGAGAAAEIEAFVRIFKEMPSLDSIIMDPTGVAVPADNRTDVRYAVSSGLAAKGDADNLQNIITYMGRVGKEFEVACLTDLHRRNPGATHCDAFVKWAVENKDVIL